MAINEDGFSQIPSRFDRMGKTTTYLPCSYLCEMQVSEDSTQRHVSRQKVNTESIRQDYLIASLAPHVRPVIVSWREEPASHSQQIDMTTPWRDND